MSIILSKGSISKLITEDWKTIGLQPVLQVLGIRMLQNQTAERYRVLLSDGSCQLDVMAVPPFSELIKSQRLQNGSIVQLTEFSCHAILEHRFVIVLDVHVILEKCDVIGNPKPFPSKNPSNSMRSSVSEPDEGHAVLDENKDAQDSAASKEKGCCGSQTQSKKRKCESSEHTIVAVAKDLSKIARMMVKKKKEEDDMGACFEKLEKLGWGTEDPMYDTAVLLFGQSADYRKLWLHLKLESCGKWVKNAGRMFGLLG